MKIIVLVASLLVTAGCSSMGVEPWDRDVLAKDEMQLTTDALEAVRRVVAHFGRVAAAAPHSAQRVG